MKVPGYFGSGDLVDFVDPDPGDIHPDFSNSTELKKLDVNHPIRKIFSLKHARKSQQNKALVKQYTNKLGVIHNVDYSNSLEAKIINLTFSLRHVQAELTARVDNIISGDQRKTIANSLKGRRYRYLCELKELHSDRYERIIKALSIEPKNNLINVKYHRPYRKIQLRLLAIQYSRDLIEKKVEDFLASLEAEKAQFQQDRAETLKWIEEQEKKLGMTV